MVLAGEYRQQHTNGYTQIAAGGTYATLDTADRESEEGKDFRGYVKATGGYVVSDHSVAGYDVYLTTDNTFLDRYGIDNQQVLQSRIFLEGQEDRNFWSVNGYYFQGLRTFDDQDKIPVALPLAETRLVSDRSIWGSYFTANSNVLALTRNDGLDTRRVSNRVGWTMPYVGPIGDVYRVDVSLRGDIYNTEGDPETFDSTGGEKAEARILPRFTADWSWPLADATGAWVHQVEPMVSLNVAPTFGNTNKIPNEDSTDFEFDETNLFEPSRFPGLDRVDTGTKVAYGLRFSNFGPRATEFSGSFGQSYSLQENSFIPANSGVQDNLSDYVGALYARPGPWLDLSYRFRLGKSDLQFRRSDALAWFGPAFLRFNLGYLNLSKEPKSFDSITNNNSDPNGFNSREEIVAGVRARLTERLAIGAQTRYDLSANQAVANQVGLIYTHPCLVLAVGFEQRLTPDAQLGDQTAVLVRVTFENSRRLRDRWWPVRLLVEGWSTLARLRLIVGFVFALSGLCQLASPMPVAMGTAEPAADRGGGQRRCDHQPGPDRPPGAGAGDQWPAQQSGIDAAPGPAGHAWPGRREAAAARGRSAESAGVRAGNRQCDGHDRPTQQDQPRRTRPLPDRSPAEPAHAPRATTCPNRMDQGGGPRAAPPHRGHPGTDRPGTQAQCRCHR